METKQGIFMREITAESKEAVIDVVGVIGWEVWFPAMRDMLHAIPDTIERVIFDIYSPGGDVWEGNAIIQEIGALKQTTVAKVQVAASMATLIAAACDEREIASNGRWLIHNPWTMIQGDAGAMEKRAKELRDCENEAAAFYATRTGKTAEEMLALMEEERWLTPQESMDFGFVQKINDPFDVAAFAAVRSEIEKSGKWPVALVEIPALETFDCECIKCGEAIKSEKHCKDLKCEKCGGQMRRKERPGPGEDTKGESKNDADTTGTESEAAKDDVQPVKPEDGKPVEMSQDYKNGFAAGDADASHRINLEFEKKIEGLTSIAGLATAEKTKRDDLIKKMQSERDQALARIETLQKSLKESSEHLTKLLSGGMTFSAPIESFEEAMNACGGDYAKARKEYPEAFRMQREHDREKRGRKGK